MEKANMYIGEDNGFSVYKMTPYHETVAFSENVYYVSKTRGTIHRGQLELFVLNTHLPEEQWYYETLEDDYMCHIEEVDVDE